MRNTKAFLGLLTAFSVINFDNDSEHYHDVQTKEETEEERIQRITKLKEERRKEQGLSEFVYGNNKIWALNQKSADKKAKRLNWI